MNTKPVEDQIVQAMKRVEVEKIIKEILSNVDMVKNFDKISSYMDKLMEKSGEIIKLYQTISSINEKCQSAKQTYNLLRDQLNLLRNNLSEYKNAIQNGDTILADVYKKQIQTSIDTVTKKKTELIKNLQLINSSSKTYIQKSDQIRNSITNESTKEIGDDSKLAQNLKEEASGIESLVGEKNEHFKQVKLVENQSQVNIDRIGHLNSFSFEEELPQKLEEQLINWEDALRDYKSLEIPKVEESRNTSAKEFKLLDTVKQVMNDGVLGMVVEDMNAVSNRTFSLEGLPSKEKYISTNDEKVLAIDKTTNSILLNEYLLEYLSNYKDKNNTYELEYIIGGKPSDKENLSIVAEKLLLVRQVMNYTYLISDTEKREMANQMAMAVLGVTTIGVAAVPIVSTLILMAWAYAESVNDVKALFSGEKVPFIKTKSNWKLSLEGAAKGEWTKVKKNDKGFDYLEYMRILLFLRSRDSKIYRGLDMIQLHVCEKAPEFRIANCLYQLEADAVIQAKSMFLSFPFLKNFKSNGFSEYIFEEKIAYQY
ncbi:hypothetical protein P261_01337 [Lachnospiraceae bacterium TWA4]|nr:hypothetical protein P261_01337 [Lachnospiraceae bacterium TWA4]